MDVTELRIVPVDIPVGFPSAKQCSGCGAEVDDVKLERLEIDRRAGDGSVCATELEYRARAMPCGCDISDQ